MTLAQLITTLKTNDVLVTIQGADEKEICRIYSNGADALDDALEAREVAKWLITSSKAITVTVTGA